MSCVIGTRAVQAPGQALDGNSSPDVPSAEREAATQSGEQEKQIEIGKIEDRDLRSILNEMVRQIQTEAVNYADAIEAAVNEINHAAGVIKLDEREKNEESEEIREARNTIERYLAVLLYIAPDEDWDRADLVQRACDANDQLHPLINQEYPEDIRIQNLRNLIYQCEMIATRYDKKLTGDILEEELENIQKGIEAKKPKKAKKRKNKADKSDKTNKAEAEQNGEIDAGLLNDIDTEDSKE